MKLTGIRTLSLPLQCVICAAVVGTVALSCFLLEDVADYRVTALVLLLTVSVLAMLFEIMPVLLAATVSAVLWNFFFIPPVFTFLISSAEDVLLFLLYFVIALVNTVLSVRIRQAESKARDKEEQERSVKAYTALLNSLSQELQMPVSAIVTAAYALKERDGRLTLAERSKLLDTIEEAGERLDRDAVNILNMGRLGSGTLHPTRTWCDVNEVVGDVARKFEASPGHPVIFLPDAGLPLFKLDGGLLEQMLHNLMHNAAVHTPKGTCITIAASHAHGACVITVADNGPGIPDTEAQRVFNRFHHLPGVQKDRFGFGLSIVKGLVEVQKGTVALTTNDPSGSVFTVSIPAEVSFRDSQVMEKAAFS